METVDEDILDYTLKFIDKAEKDGKPFFVWMNPTRVHVISHLSPKYQAKLTPENGWYLEEGVMSQLDDVVGGVMDKLKADGLDNNTIVVFTTDNGAENFTWPDGGNTPFAAGKGTIMEGGMRVPMIARWPGHIPAGKVENGIFSGLDFFPTLVAFAGNPTIKDDLLKGKQLGDRTYKVHLDGYDQIGRADRQRAVQPPRDLLFRRRHSGCGSYRRLEIPNDRPARRMDRRNGPRSICRSSPICGSIRSSGWDSRRATTGSFEYLGDFYHPRVLALRLPAAEGRRIRADVHRLSRRCSGGRASISRRSKPKSRRG